MAKEISLTSQKWNDIIFEGKNKDYGAYEMRKSSSKRHIIALIVIAVFVVFVSFLPLLVETIAAGLRTESLDGDVVLADLQQLEDQVKEKDIIRDQAVEPPPVLKSTIQFTVPEIVPKEQIAEDEEIKAQEDLAESKVQISVATVEGVEKGGVDIADLNQHKVVAEVEDKVFDSVEQMPEYPGGRNALTRFIQSKLQYPEIAASNGIKGTVTIGFIVGIDGSISEITVLDGVKDRSLQAEALRVVKLMPKWIPGKQNGQGVKVRMKYPITFNLQE